ncbi:MAG: DUF481 domain-containing protein [Acidobacteria bacterium]|nr:DUF481 domain-containing protein [Acidobacteriota bacterium]
MKLLKVAVVMWMIGLGAVTASAEEKPAQQLDTIVFVNGDQLTGVLVRGVGNSVIFKSDMAGEITVPLAKIKELRSSGSFAVLRKDTQVHRGDLHLGTVSVTNGNVVLLSPIGAPEVIPVKEVGYILDQPTIDREVERKAGFLYGWSGTVSGGATIVQSTQYGRTFHVGVSLARTVPTVAYLRARNRTLVDLQETYGKLTTPAIPPLDQNGNPKPDSVVKTSIFHTALERDQYFTKRFYALGTMAFDHNYAQGLELQTLYGGGVGWTPISTPKQQLDVKADLHYTKEEFQDPFSNQNLFASSIAETYKLTLPRKMLLTQALSILPAWNNLDAYAANGNVTFAMPVFKRLAMSVSAADSFLNNPSFGYKKNSFQLVTGITYSLK